MTVSPEEAPQGASRDSTRLNRAFQDVDHTPELKLVQEFLRELDSLKSIRLCKEQMLRLAPVGPEDRILDVGCGLGFEVERLAASLRRPGIAVGLDSSKALIEQARIRTAGNPEPLEFRIGDAQAMAFPDRSFQLCRSERILLYVQDAERVLDEMVRVLDRNGRMVVFDLDYGGAVVDGPDGEITGSMGQFLVESVPHGCIGRRLPRLFKQRNLVDLEVVPHPLLLSFGLYRAVVGGVLEERVESGRLSSKELARWWKHLEAADARGDFFCSMLGFIVSGRKP